MNIALPALVAFVLVLPGFVFRDRLQRKERETQDFAPFGRVVSESIVIAWALHAVWLVAADLLFDQVFKLDLLLALLGSAPDAQARAYAEVGRQTDWLLLYFGSLAFAAFVVPTAIQASITRYRLDRIDHPMQRFLRFKGAPWYYLLTGADFARRDVPDMIKISAIVNVAGSPVLYQGVLDEFFVTPAGELDRLVLHAVARRPLDNDKTASGDVAGPPAPENGAERFYPIDGDYFVLRYQEVITLNVAYVKLEKAEPGSVA